MSTTFYTAEARITQSAHFDLDSFISELHDQCIRENNFIVENYGIKNDKVDCDFESYVSIVDEDVMIRVDTSDNTNSDSEVFEWLVDRATEFTGNHAQVSWSCEDSREGNSNWSYTIIDGDQVDNDTLIRDHKILNLIASKLSGSEWDSELMSEIAEFVQATGRTVADVEE